MEYVKIIVVPYRQTIDQGTAKEVLPANSGLVNSGRQAYAKITKNANILVQSATKQEYVDYSSGKEIYPNPETRTVNQLAGNINPGKGMNELIEENYGF